MTKTSDGERAVATAGEGRGRRCKFCERPYPVSDEDAAENPFCQACLHERVRLTRRCQHLGCWMDTDGDWFCADCGATWADEDAPNPAPTGGAGGEGDE